MKAIPIMNIRVAPDRQRRERNEEEHQNLIASIQARGLLHPIVLREVPGEMSMLVAGERRLNAMKEIFELGGHFEHDKLAFGPDGEGPEYSLVPYTTLGELSRLEAEEAELEENLRRVDLSWQDRAQAETRLVALRAEQAAASGLPPPRNSDIARETRGADSPAAARAVTQSTILASNLHRPEVAKAKSAAEALKILGRQETSERNALHAAALGKDFLGGKHRLFNANALDWLRDSPNGEFDVICSDVPYGMGADEFGDSGGGAAGAHFYSDSYEYWCGLMGDLIPATFQASKPDAHLYLFCDIDRFHELRRWVELAGWTPFRTPLLWFKPAAFRAPWPEHGPQRKYECILYARKGTLKCTKLAGDVLQYPPDVNLGHPAQKPVALIQDLLSRSVRPGMKVLDMCCGTGPIFPAAHALSAIATGIELDPAAYAIAAGRLEKLKEKA